MRWRINWGGVMESGLKFRVIWTGGNSYVHGGGRWLGGAVRVVEPLRVSMTGEGKRLFLSRMNGFVLVFLSKASPLHAGIQPKSFIWPFQTA
jgi:hypothetical protein